VNARPLARGVLGENARTDSRDEPPVFLGQGSGVPKPLDLEASLPEGPSTRARERLGIDPDGEMNPGKELLEIG
jgi:hypothetical protein